MTEKTDLLRHTAKIVSSLVSRSSLTTSQMAEAIEQAFHALAAAATVGQTPPAPKPAVPIRRSIQRDRVICLECGFEAKMLRRHLGATHGLTPAEYRSKWGLASDHALVAPSYAQERSAAAKRIGLGRTRRGRRSTRS